MIPYFPEDNRKQLIADTRQYPSRFRGGGAQPRQAPRQYPSMFWGSSAQSNQTSDPFASLRGLTPMDTLQTKLQNPNYSAAAQVGNPNFTPGGLDKLAQMDDTVNVAPSSQSRGCCFIFMESYNGSLPLSVRLYRDLIYSLDDHIARGYIRMSKWLVPCMKRSNLARNVVNRFMIKPLTCYGEWFYCNGKLPSKSAFAAKRVWFNIWKLTGLF